MEDQEFEQLQKKLDDFMENENRRPREEMDNLSPNDMYTLLYHTFEASSPIQLSNPKKDEELVEKVPFLKLMLYFLKKIHGEGELKLTAKGNLSRKLCHELYGLEILKEEPIEQGIVKLSKEEDSLVLQNIKIVADLSGLSKKRQGKLSLTAKGKKMLAKPYELFRLIYLVHGQKFNWSYHDLYHDEGAIQSTFGFLLYLLIQYGNEEKKTEFYSRKHIAAFPMIYEEAIIDYDYSNPEKYYDGIIKVRLFERFLDWFGLIKLRLEGRKYVNEEYFVSTTEIFREIFTIDPTKFQFNKPDNFA
ncbi:MAG: hypothetical protein AAF696_05735 [Bacteroidota bacterium]